MAPPPCAAGEPVSTVSLSWVCHDKWWGLLGSHQHRALLNRRCEKISTIAATASDLPAFRTSLVAGASLVGTQKSPFKDEGLNPGVQIIKIIKCQVASPHQWWVPHAGLPHVLGSKLIHSFSVVRDRHQPLLGVFLPLTMIPYQRWDNHPQHKQFQTSVHIKSPILSQPRNLGIFTVMEALSLQGCSFGLYRGWIPTQFYDELFIRHEKTASNHQPTRIPWNLTRIWMARLIWIPIKWLMK